MTRPDRRGRTVYAGAGVTLVHGDAFAVDAPVYLDALITDTPYSEKTHRGHDSGAARAGQGYRKANGVIDTGRPRRAINYLPWTPADVEAFVARWGPIVRGWFVSITDSVLVPVWSAALEALGRYVFDDLPYVAPGSRVRMAGDGPSNWTTRIVVARPRTAEFVRWGTLPGAYVLPPGQRERMPVVGGKPVWLLEQLVEDYTRPGDLVADPCAGGGTLGVATMRLGRSAFLVERDAASCKVAAERLRREARALRSSRAEA